MDDKKKKSKKKSPAKKKRTAKKKKAPASKKKKVAKKVRRPALSEPTSVADLGPMPKEGGSLRGRPEMPSGPEITETPRRPTASSATNRGEDGTRGQRSPMYGEKPKENGPMSERMKMAAAAVVVGLFFIVLLTLTLGLGSNDDQDYQIYQSIGGTVEVIDTPGWYIKLGATVWTYPRSVQKYFSASTDEGGAKDESIRVTFNDGGTAQISAMVRFQSPITEELRRKSHRDFSGSVDNMSQAVRAHLINCAKSTAPLMSASEHQSARKAEFSQLVENQLTKGLFKMRRTERDKQPKLDDTGNPVIDDNGKPVYEEHGLRFTTEILTDDDGQPIIAQTSPLQTYGITILQFSVTATDYDTVTRQQFEAKKQSFLAAEKSKAEREQEVQQRLMVTEKGLREAAEAEAVANVEMTKATILADQEKQVAETAAEKTLAVAELTKQEALTKALQDKEVAETEAAKLVAVAELTKQEALTKAQQEVEVAELMKQAAVAEAEAIVTLAEAEAVKIDKAGALTEVQQALIDAAIQRDSKVAEALSKIAVPSVILNGGNGGQGPGGFTNDLINLNLLQSLGILGNKEGHAFKPMIIPEHAPALAPATE